MNPQSASLHSISPCHSSDLVLPGCTSSPISKSPRNPDPETYAQFKIQPRNSGMLEDMLILNRHHLPYAFNHPWEDQLLKLCAARNECWVPWGPVGTTPTAAEPFERPRGAFSTRTLFGFLFALILLPTVIRSL